MGLTNKQNTDPQALLEALAIPARGDWHLTLDHGQLTDLHLTTWTLFRTYHDDQKEAVSYARDLTREEMVVFLNGLRFGQSYDWTWRG